MSRARRIPRQSRQRTGILGRAAVAAIVTVWLLVRRQAGRFAERAERAYPGPLESPGRRAKITAAPRAGAGRG